MLRPFLFTAGTARTSGFKAELNIIHTEIASCIGKVRFFLYLCGKKQTKKHDEDELRNTLCRTSGGRARL